MPKVTESHLEARRQQILDAAETCFIRKGFHQTSMDDICEEAGLSPGAVYRYFAGKSEIIRAAVRSVPDRDLLAWVEDEMSKFGDFRAFMSMVLGLMTDRFTEEPNIQETMRLRLAGWAEALQDETVREDVVGRWEQHIAVGEQVIKRAQELGQVNPDLDPRDAATVLQAIEDGLTMMWVVDPAIDVPRLNDVRNALLGGSFWIGDGDRPERSSK